MKRLVRFAVVRFTVGILLFGAVIFPAQAYTSLYVFGDGVCTTTNNPFAGEYYYGLRRSNGRVWIEVLAQRQGLGYDSNKNWSYFGQFCTNLWRNVTNFPAPPDSNTVLMVVWCCDADFVWNADYDYPEVTNIVRWTNNLNQSLTYHYRVITNLYGKGVRTLVMPNAVDVAKIPQFNGLDLATRNFIRQRTTNYNAAFAATLNQARASLTNLTIYSPDMFTLLDNFVAHAADYGLTNALYEGRSIDAKEDPALTNKALNGPGTNYIFWDENDPTAKAHAVMADITQQLISPAQITNFTMLNGSNRLEVAHIPIGLNGFVDGRTNLLLGNWLSQTNFNSTNATLTIFVPASSDSMRFYRLRFPYAWSWP